MKLDGLYNWAMEFHTMKTVYLVRHGQSIDNVSPVFQSTNSPLSDKGKQQAEQIASRVNHLAFEALISSPIKRAAQTAAVISEVTGKQIEFSELFAERIKPKIIDGKSYYDSEAAEVWRRWEESLFIRGRKVADGENFDEITKRAEMALTYMLERKESSILVVTHGFFLRTILAKVLLSDGLNGGALKSIMRSTSMENTALTVLKFSDEFEEDPQWRLWTHNDHAHLAE